MFVFSLQWFRFFTVLFVIGNSFSFSRPSSQRYWYAILYGPCSFSSWYTLIFLRFHCNSGFGMLFFFSSRFLCCLLSSVPCFNFAKQYILIIIWGKSVNFLSPRKFENVTILLVYLGSSLASLKIIYFYWLKILFLTSKLW